MSCRWISAPFAIFYLFEKDADIRQQDSKQRLWNESTLTLSCILPTVILFVSHADEYRHLSLFYLFEKDADIRQQDSKETL
jgi:hypothetical protein